MTKTLASPWIGKIYRLPNCLITLLGLYGRIPLMPGRTKNRHWTPWAAIFSNIKSWNIHCVSQSFKLLNTFTHSYRGDSWCESGTCECLDKTHSYWGDSSKLSWTTPVFEYRIFYTGVQSSTTKVKCWIRGKMETHFCTNSEIDRCRLK